MSLPSRLKGCCAAAYSSLHSDSALSTLPSSMITQVLSNNQMFKMKNGSFSVLDLLKRPLHHCCPSRPFWYPLSSAPGWIKARGSVILQQPGAMLISLGQVTTKGHTDVIGLGIA